LTAQQLAHGAIAFGKQVNVLVRHLYTPFDSFQWSFSPLLLYFLMISHNAQIVYHALPEKANIFVK
ncbi:MAG: hypothetical protein IIU57_04140, partial [Oscillospiraceae bacterium]|nr:hypothetical protein [Oscillospiraceae bacterium]